MGKPYRVRGKWYTPKEDPNYDKAGLASWYGPNFHGRLTANGEIYDQFHLSAAHPTFPLPSYARVTNKKNGNSVIVRVNDRGPFAHGRIIDLSNKAAQLLDMKHEGVAAVRVQYVGRAPVEGDDTRYLMASYQPGGSDAPAGGVIASGVMLAMNAVDQALPGVGSAASSVAPRQHWARLPWLPTNRCRQAPWQAHRSTFRPVLSCPRSGRCFPTGHPSGFRSPRMA
ncbi:septal ring lytic transglycosylase RlpA family protein [Hoeflea alexandrii]|uniref:septal ring lytic transglycosylase RlpA family protein n=1 Tax=Hoeflea alexandrii TaxID=288436 RepID=UPI003CCD36EC